MKNWFSYILVAITIIWLIILTFSFVTYVRHTNSQIGIIIGENKVNLSSNTEILIINARLQQIIEYNGDLLATVYWSLGFASTFLLAFLGLVGYLTNRRYEQDKESLSAILTSQLSNIKTEFEGKTQSLSAELQTQQTSNKEDLNKFLDENIKTAQSTIITKIETQFNSQLSSLRSDSLRLKYDILEIEAKDHEARKVYINAFRAYFDMAKVSREIGWDWMTSGALESIMRIIDLGCKLSASDINHITVFLNNLPSNFELLIKKLKGKL